MSGTWHAIELGPDLRPSHGRVIASGPTRESVLAHWQPGRVVIGWTADEQPIRRLSADGLAKVRRARLARRLAAKVPLFADQLFKEELARRPGFYAGERGAPDHH